MFFIILIGVMFFFPLNHLRAQPDSSAVRPPVTGLRAHYGFIIIHSSALQSLRQARPRGMELDISRHLITPAAWAYCGCYPRAGLMFNFWDFGNAAILGYSVSAMGYLEPVFMPERTLSVTLRMGMGFAYQSRPYNPATNPDNEAYSTFWGFPLLVSAGVFYRLGPRLRFAVAANYNHISNGGAREPNKGINYPTFNAGVDYTWKDARFPTRQQRYREPPEKKNYYELTYLSAFSNAFPDDPTQYYVWGLSAIYSRWVWRTSALSAGTEWVEDHSKKEKIERSGSLWGDDFRQGSVLFGHEFRTGRVTFSQQIGIYYFDKYRGGLNEPWYHRWGLTVNITRRFFTGINLKAHRHVADFLDIRAGITF